MPEVSDVELMELADGTLPESRRRAIEAELTGNAELRQRLEAFQATGRALSRLFDPVVEAPVPPALVDTILRGAQPRQEAPHRTTSTLIQFPTPARAQTKFGWRPSPGTAIAAGMVCAIAVAGMLWAIGIPQTRVRMAEASVALALEKTPSAQAAGVRRASLGGGTLTPELSFRHKDGRYCRQYVMQFDAGPALAGFACNNGEGRWQIEAEAETAVAKQPARDTLRPAGPGVTVRSVEMAIDEAMRGDALEIGNERQLIDSGWSADTGS